MWPTMELMVRIATAFDVSVDYLIRDTENVALDRIKSKALLHQVEQVSMLPEKDQEVVVSFLDAFIKRRKFEELIRS